MLYHIIPYCILFISYNNDLMYKTSIPLRMSVNKLIFLRIDFHVHFLVVLKKTNNGKLCLYSKRNLYTVNR